MRQVDRRDNFGIKDIQVSGDWKEAFYRFGGDYIPCLYRPLWFKNGEYFIQTVYDEGSSWHNATKFENKHLSVVLGSKWKKVEGTGFRFAEILGGTNRDGRHDMWENRKFGEDPHKYATREVTAEEIETFKAIRNGLGYNSYVRYI